jgi:hypothetical protein
MSASQLFKPLQAYRSVQNDLDVREASRKIDSQKRYKKLHASTAANKKLQSRKTTLLHILERAQAMALSLFDFAPFDFGTMDASMLGPSSRELRALNRAAGDYTSGPRPALARLPGQQGASTAMVSYSRSALELYCMQASASTCVALPDESINK